MQRNATFWAHITHHQPKTVSMKNCHADWAELLVLFHLIWHFCIVSVELNTNTVEFQMSSVGANVNVNFVVDLEVETEQRRLKEEAAGKGHVIEFMGMQKWVPSLELEGSELENCE